MRRKIQWRSFGDPADRVLNPVVILWTAQWRHG